MTLTPITATNNDVALYRDYARVWVRLIATDATGAARTTRRYFDTEPEATAWVQETLPGARWARHTR